MGRSAVTLCLLITDGFVPQAKRPKKEAEVDFADFRPDLGRRSRTCV
jgi:hypothetical protein